jgi:hypothetical protein
MTDGIGKDLEGSRYGLIKISQHLLKGTEEYDKRFQSEVLASQHLLNMSTEHYCYTSLLGVLIACSTGQTV